ncbi:unnamed protein product, partial [Strongylus vulgaris]
DPIWTLILPDVSADAFYEYNISLTFLPYTNQLCPSVSFTVRRSKKRKDSTLRKMTKHITRVVAYSKLEMENSEIDNGSYTNTRPQSLRAMLKEDAIYRIRFAMPQSVGVIQEEDENSEARQEEEATVARAFIESAQFLERPVFVDEDSNSGFSEHML